MTLLHIPATSSSPEVALSIAPLRLSLRGESFPENAAAFYSPVIAALRDVLAQPPADERPFTVEVALTYFNSSSTKMLFTLFDLLDRAAAGGRAVQLLWLHDVEDDTIREFGEELKSDFAHLQVELQAVDA